MDLRGLTGRGFLGMLLLLPCCDEPERGQAGLDEPGGGGKQDAVDEGSDDGSAEEQDDGATGSLRLYVSAKKRMIVVYAVDEESGELTEVENKRRARGQIGPLVTNPSNSTLYAATDWKSLQSYAIDPQTGELDETGLVRVGYEAVYLDTDRTGEYLLTADMANDRIEIYSIADGPIEEEPVASVKTCARPHSVVVDANNAFVFVPCRDGDAIAQFKFDAETGTVTPNDPPEVALPEGTGPRHLVISSDGARAYVSGETNSTLNVFDYDHGAGQLAFVEALSTIPDGYGDNTTADVHITPDDDTVYVSNRGHDSIAVFDVGAGERRALTPTEAMPREFALTPSGRFLYAAGQSSGKLASYEVKDDGTLEAGETYEVGTQAVWVLPVELPTP